MENFSLGQHLIVDFWQSDKLNDRDGIHAALVAATVAAKASLLHIHLHKFGGHGGVTGVALLAESHISIHTWPERDYAAIDIFICGQASADAALACLQQQLQPQRVKVHTVTRGA